MNIDRKQRQQSKVGPTSLKESRKKGPMKKDQRKE